ncbi:MAG TPA: LysM peptidoglycan-binding domain-containing protein [Anaerolineae bacterium]|nr:LysM peptidoglycan-binding domain-containing protein [Anaerolineae bacterium]
MSENTKICPTCGTRIPATATRCPVCGTAFTAGEGTPQLKPGRFPEVTLSLPLALAMLAFFVALGAGMVYFALSQMNRIAEPTPIPSATPSPSPTLTPTPVTPTPTFTPLPSPTPFIYEVKAGDTCSSIALAFGISVRSLVLLNNLPAACDTLFVGQKLLIPQPTPTPSPQPTGTLSPAEATKQACDRVIYEVKENDTLSSIALNYGVPMDAIRRYNGLVGDQVFFGQKLIIPLCERNPTPGPTPTPTPPPPYPAPSLLLPVDGAVFTLADEAVVLQWASVGELRDNEAYAVTVEDVTADRGRKLVAYVTDTKYIVPNDFRPTESKPHVFRWWVVTVRQTGTDENGNPIWTPAGARSESRTFAWVGVAPAATPTPSP